MQFGKDSTPDAVGVAMARDPIFTTVYGVRPCIPTSEALHFLPTPEDASLSLLLSRIYRGVVNARNLCERVLYGPTL